MAGYIKNLPNGKYLAQIYLGVDPVTKKRRDLSKSFASTAEAKAWISIQLGDRAKGEIAPLLSKDTFETYLRDTWLPWYREEIRKRGSSTYNIESRLGKWIFRAAASPGRTKMKDLSTLQFSKFYTALERAGMAHESIKHLHSILHRALDFAVSQDLLKTNPASKAKLPSKPVAAPGEAEGKECMTLEQARRFRGAAVSDPYGPLWSLLLATGVRPGEAYALQWKHIDFENGRVSVQQSLTYVHTSERKEAGRGWKIKVTKTRNSVRAVPVPADTMDVLRHWKAEQAEMRLQMGSEWRNHNFVFTKANGEPLGPNMSSAWTRIMRAADGGQGDLGVWGPVTVKPQQGPQAERTFAPKFSMYTCRHTFATLLYEAGVPIDEIARLLGNTVEMVRKHYALRERKCTQQGVEVFTRLFEPGLKLMA